MKENNKNCFYISTAIPYVNARPHLGFALEIVQADVLARYNRLLGHEVFFLTGTDENALKNVITAKENRVTTQELVDDNSAKFKDLRQCLNLSWDDFIRTTEDRHVKGAKKLWLACKKGEIYKKLYKGLYCVGCEEFKNERELVNSLCPEHPNRKLEEVEENNYFFKLSAYQKNLEGLIQSRKLEIVPDERRNEVLSFIRQGLVDFSISRSKERAQGWGIPVPDDETQIQYVWFDALTNYINALGYSENSDKFNKYWQDNRKIVHVIGKGVSRFHSIYWPAMLMSAGLNLPKTIFVHGYITVGGQKISKSLGNVIDPVDLADKYGIDAVRYYLLREISTFGDGDFTIERFKELYNSGLANGLGNLASRVIKMAVTYDVRMPDVGIVYKSNEHLDKFEIQKAINQVWEKISEADKFIQQNEPFKKIKTDPDKAKKDVSHLLGELHAIAVSLQPFMPATAEKILSAFEGGPVKSGEPDHGASKIKEIGILFPRME